MRARERRRRTRRKDDQSGFTNILDFGIFAGACFGFPSPLCELQEPPTPPVTILDFGIFGAMFGLPAGRDMGGVVLSEALDPDLAAAPLTFIPTWDEPGRFSADPVPIRSPMNDEIMNRLKGLGYISD